MDVGEGREGGWTWEERGRANVGEVKEGGWRRKKASVISDDGCHPCFSLPLCVCVQETEQLLEEDKKLLEYVDDVDHDMEGGHCLVLRKMFGTALLLQASLRLHVRSSLKLSVRPTEYVKSLEDIVEQKLQLFAKFKGLKIDYFYWYFCCEWQ